ncbi:MAG: DUF58 domain-containing protein [Myxococcota bacterium]
MERLGSLELRARTLVEGVLAGMHASRLTGDNVEFAGHREYVPGDDIKNIDWKAYGRRDRFYVKESVDETNLHAHLVVDISGSMAYPGDGMPDEGVTKGAYAAQLAAALACIVLEQGDAAGLYMFPGDYAPLPPRSSGLYLREIAFALESAGHQRGGSLATAAARIAGAATRRGMVVIISDLLDDDPAAPGAIAQLARRGHDVTVFHVLDRSELDFPFAGLSLFCDPESDGQVVAEPASIAKAYRAEFASFVERWRDACVNSGVDYRPAVTDSALEEVLRSFLQDRRRRIG